MPTTKTTKQTVELTDDNWADYFAWDQPDELVKGLSIGEDGVGPESGVVALLRAWVAERNRVATERHYELSKHDAAVILNLAAGQPA